MASYVPHASAIPSAILLTDCALSSGSHSRKAWPWCTQPLFSTAAPVTVNITILNGVSVHGSVVSCEFEASENGHLLDVSFEYGELWPWTGWLAVTLSAVEAAEQWQGIAEGSIVVVIRSDRRSAPRVPSSAQYNASGSSASGGGGSGSGSTFLPDDGSHAAPWGMTAVPAGGGRQSPQMQPTAPEGPYYSTSSTETLRIPVKAEIIPRPARSLRLLWDQFHSIQYPPGYIPADMDPAEDGPPSGNLDWHGGMTRYPGCTTLHLDNPLLSPLRAGCQPHFARCAAADHIHTNFRGLYSHLRSKGYFVDVLSRDLTCFEAALYSSLLLVDTEEDFSALEVEKLEKDVLEGLSVIVFADWHDPEYSASNLRFRDDNTRRWWSPAVGGANIPSINELLRPFGIAFGAGRLSGTFSLDGKTADFSDGTILTRFPMTGRVVYTSLREPAGIYGPAATGTVPATAKEGRVEGPTAADAPAGASTAGGATATDGEGGREFPVFGMVSVAGAGSFLAAFGDSGCIDDGQLQQQQASNCYFLVDRICASALVVVDR